MKIDENFNVIGDYPPVLDIGNCSLNIEYLMMDPCANLNISDKSTLQHLRIGNSFWGNHSVSIKDCENLKTLEIYDQGTEDSAKYIICRNLPSLNKIIVRGGILLLDVSKCKELSEIDLDNCRNIVEFHCFPHEQLRTFSIKGCIKLRRIGGLDDDARKRLKVDLSAISKSGSLQEVSFPFSNLNCGQVDDILQLINNALIVKARDTDRNEALEYSINLLKPGEYTNTNNTGEVYPYELCYGSSAHGEHNPEDCLQTAILEIADDFDIEGENLTEIINNTLFHIRSLYENISIEKEKIVNSKIEITNEMAAFISKFGGYSGNENTTFEYIPTLIIGSKVNHKKFGDGVVLNRVGAGDDERAQVEFSGVGIKWFALSVAKLSVLE